MIKIRNVDMSEQSSVVLAPKKLADLKQWYQAWLDAPSTMNVPEPLDWINKSVSQLSL